MADPATTSIPPPPTSTVSESISASAMGIAGGIGMAGARKGVGVGVPWAAPGSEADDPLLLDEVNSIETDDELGAAINTADNLWGQVILSDLKTPME